MSEDTLTTIVLVHWHDAGSGSSVEDSADHYRQSVGYLVKYTEEGIWITMEHDNLSPIHHIPHHMLTEPPQALSPYPLAIS